MKKLVILMLLILLVVLAKSAYATNYSDIINNDIQPDQVDLQKAAGVDVNSVSEIPNYYPYIVSNFESVIKINQNTSLDITEKINVHFNEARHGIFRIIPVIYSANGQTIRAGLDVKSVTNENGIPFKYEVSWLYQSRQIKIGDPNITVTGDHTYFINYKITKVLQRFNDHDELYWNVTGHEWDTRINNTAVEIISPNAEIVKTKCFAGAVGTTEENCLSSKLDNSVNTAKFNAKTVLGNNSDMTIVISLNPQNTLNFPNGFEKLVIFMIDNWGYGTAVVPLIFILYFWFKKGRDKKYLSDNVYFKPKNTPQKTVSLFERKILPLVYSPIKDLSPSQIGTIIDEKVDTKDVVAEIVELARLGYLQIKKVTKKRFLGQTTDYVFISNSKDLASLNNYQKYLYESLFNPEAIKTSKSKLPDYKIVGITETVLLSSLKDNFYEYLEEFKKKLYKNVAEKGYFDADPAKVTGNWKGYYLAVSIVFGLITFIYAGISGDNFAPFFLFCVLYLPGQFVANFMPRRTAWGYSLLNQINGLKYYVEKGKWRTEIAEKNMFLEEILPIAISLGIVDKLAGDMKSLGLTPPKYVNGMTVASFNSDFSGFNRSMVSNITSSPKGSGWSGSSSWSGGSGFSGGSSGGGFGGGGGGSW